MANYSLAKTIYRKIIPSFIRRRMRPLFETLAYVPEYYYGQDGEDVFLRLFCDKSDYKGFYVDIGAYNPRIFSNTKWFYDRGWHGINIDANPSSIKLFNRKRKRDINILSGVSDISGEMNYYYWGESSSMNTFNEDLYKKWSNDGMKIKEIKKVKVQTINDILDKHLQSQQHIDFVTLDVEGFEMKIIQNYNFEKYAPEYFLIEALDFANNETDFMDFRNEPLYVFMKSKGYIIIAKTRLTIVFKRSLDKS